MKATILGDIHGKTELIKWSSTQPIIQIGDFGFAESYYEFFNTPQSELMIVGGNHDEYPALIDMPAYLGDYGIIPGTEKTFFCRGAWSIDRTWRTEGINWWKEEELSALQGSSMLNAYEEAKPQIMITHDCPDAVKRTMFKVNPVQTFTGRLFDECLKIHQPKIWIFGHWHISRTHHWGDSCKFICLAEGEHLEIDLP